MFSESTREEEYFFDQSNSRIVFLSKYCTLKLSEIHNPHPFFIESSVLAEDSRALRFGKGIRRLLHGFLGVLGFSGGTNYATSVGIAPGMIWALPHI